MSYRALLGEINGSKSSASSLPMGGLPPAGNDTFKNLMPGGTDLGDLFNKSKSLASATASVTTGSNPRDSEQGSSIPILSRGEPAKSVSKESSASLIAVPRSE